MEHAVARHGQLDEEGDPPPCQDLDDALDALFGTGTAKVEKPEAAGPEAAVRAAWERAIAEGMPEIEAAERCIEAARAFDEQAGRRA